MCKTSKTNKKKKIKSLKNENEIYKNLNIVNSPKLNLVNSPKLNLVNSPKLILPSINFRKSSFIILIFPNIKNAALVVKITKGNYRNLWTWPGGRQEPGENNYQTATREFKEEVNNVNFTKFKAIKKKIIVSGDSCHIYVFTSYVDPRTILPSFNQKYLGSLYYSTKNETYKWGLVVLNNNRLELYDKDLRNNNFRFHDLMLLNYKEALL